MKVIVGSSVATASPTTFFPFAVGVFSASTKNADASWPVRAGVAQGLSFNVSAYVTGSSTGLVLQKNGVDTALSIVVVGGATGRFENLTDVVSFADGDTAAFKGAGINTPVRGVSLGYSFDAGPPFPVRYGAGRSVATSAGVQYYSPISYTDILATTISNTIATFPEVAGVVDDIQADVWVNTRTAPIFFYPNINGVDVGPGVLIPAGATGAFSLSGHPVPVNVGDQFCFVHRTTSTGSSFWFRGFRYNYLVSGPDVEYAGMPGVVGASAVPSYLNPIAPDFFYATPADATVRIPFDCSVSGFRALFSNNSAGAATFTLLKNGLPTGVVLDKPAGFSGVARYDGPPLNLAEGDTLTCETSPYTGSFAVVSMTLLVSNGSAPPPEVSPPSGELTIDGASPHLIFGQQVLPVAGALSIEGLAPVLTEFFGVRPLPGALELSGAAPALQFDADVSPLGGALRVSGGVPRVLVGITVGPGGGSMAVEGFSPGLFTQTAPLASQIASMALGAPAAPPVAAGQLAALALAEPPPPPVRASQAALLGLAEVVPHVAASQAALLVLAHGSDCVTAACQLWTIYRRDGVIFRYTSHDQPVKRGPFVYSPCRSLDPSASENASTLGSVGDIELTGIIDDDGISEADLYGGLFDDAYVTVDLFSWGDATVPPRRLAAGWTGELSQGVTGFQMQVLGPGARLGQQALVQMVTPACRWVFGDARCGVNVESMKVAGTVIASPSRGRLKVALPAEPAGRQWANGRIRFVSGPNAGQVVETKSVNFATGEVVTWVSPGFLSDPGDAVELLPGCDLARDGGCTLYKNVINFGGFPDVPGSDALLESPDAKY